MTKLPLESLVEEQALPERVSQVGGTARERKELYFELESRPAGSFWAKYSPTHRRVLTTLRGEGLPSPRSPPSALGLPPSDFLSKATF